MKHCGRQTASSEQRISLFASATEDEMYVSEILLDLENLFMASALRTEFTWGCKKRRSKPGAEASAYSPEKPASRQASVQSDGGKEAKTEEEYCTAAKSSSPTTTLSFLPSESDVKSRKSSRKRSREKYNDMIEELKECGDVLRGELEKVRNYHNELRTRNLELKAMKLQVLETRRKKEESEKETIGITNLVVDPAQNHGMTMLTHPQPFVADPTARRFQHSFGPITGHQIGSSYGLGPVSRVGPAKIPDLNLSPEEAFGVDSSQPLDVDGELAHKRARFAEARRTRRGIIKIKSMRSGCGGKLPRTRF